MYLRPDLLSNPVELDDTVSRKLTGMALDEHLAYTTLVAAGYAKKGVKKKAKEIAKAVDWRRGYDVRDTRRVGDIMYTCVDSQSQLDDLLVAMKTAPEYGVDIETHKLDPLSGAVCMTIATAEGVAWYVPAFMISAVFPHIEWEKVTGHNLKYDVQGLGFYPEFVGNDTHIVAGLNEDRLGTRDLKAQVEDEFGFKMVEFNEIVPEGKSIADIDAMVRLFYACSDADWSLRLKQERAPRMPSQSQDIYDIQMHLIPIIAEMEANGIEVDDVELQNLSDYHARNIAAYLHWIYTIAGHPFDLDSPQQVSRVLYEELGIERTRFKTSTDTDEVALQQMSHPIAKAILCYRGENKLKTTYADPLLLKRHPKDGRVHPTFNMALTASGRLSASNPNSQNPPKTKQYRSVVIAKSPDLILKIDYDQLELRTLAGMSGGSTMRRIFEQDIDIHAHTASIIFDKDIAYITSEERDRGKRGNFAIVYGAQESKVIEIGLAQTYDEAHFIIQQLILAYPDEIAYINEMKREIRRDRCAWTLHGRKRTFAEYTPLDAMEREGFNHIIQGSGFELVALGMINGRPIINNYNAQLFNQIHDEVLIRCRAWKIYQLRDEICPVMEDIDFPVPLKVKAGIAENWWDAS